jgi:hypothetical protein
MAQARETIGRHRIGARLAERTLVSVARYEWLVRETDRLLTQPEYRPPDEIPTVELPHGAEPRDTPGSLYALTQRDAHQQPKEHAQLEPHAPFQGTARLESLRRMRSGRKRLVLESVEHHHRRYGWSS